MLIHEDLVKVTIPSKVMTVLNRQNDGIADSASTQGLNMHVFGMLYKAKIRAPYVGTMHIRLCAT
jgi:hypothetical protein